MATSLAWVSVYIDGLVSQAVMPSHKKVRRQHIKIAHLRDFQEIKQRDCKEGEDGVMGRCERNLQKLHSVGLGWKAFLGWFG